MVPVHERSRSWEWNRGANVSLAWRTTQRLSYSHGNWNFIFPQNMRSQGFSWKRPTQNAVTYKKYS